MATPREIVQQWVEAFNKADSSLIADFYAENAINHQMPNTAITGKMAIKEMFVAEFAAAPNMHCIPIQIIEEGEWAVLEWRDPNGLQGCGFFNIKNDLIQIQRGYWDKLSFQKLYS